MRESATRRYPHLQAYCISFHCYAAMYHRLKWDMWYDRGGLSAQSVTKHKSRCLYEFLSVGSGTSALLGSFHLLTDVSSL